MGTWRPRALNGLRASNPSAPTASPSSKQGLCGAVLSALGAENAVWLLMGGVGIARGFVVPCFLGVGRSVGGGNSQLGARTCSPIHKRLIAAVLCQNFFLLGLF